MVIKLAQSEQKVRTQAKSPAPEELPPTDHQKVSETVFFPDTNVILHCKNFEELPWSDVTPANTIRVILAGVVCAQLDRLKNDGSSRRARRARKASSRCDEILDSKDKKIVIRKSSPTVTFELAPAAKPKAADFPDLDLSYEDDRLVAETLNFARSNPSLDVRLLTDDVGPKMTAKQHGLSYTSVPNEGWLLPAESDPRDKQLASLSQENEQLRSNYANIDVHLEFGGQRIEKIEIELPRYRPLEKIQIEELTNAAKARFPSKNAPGQGLTPYQLNSIHHQVRKAYDREYAVWEQDLRVFLVELHQVLNDCDQRKTLAFVLDCNGVRPAEKICADITASGQIVGQHFEKARPANSRSILTAPRPPKLGSPKDPARVPFPVGASYLDKTNPHVFHYIGGPDPSSALLYTCEEFSHHSAEKNLVFILMPENRANAVCNGSLECKVTARNLPFAVTKRFGVSLTFAEEDAFPLAEKLVNEIVLEQ